MTSNLDKCVFLRLSVIITLSDVTGNVPLDYTINTLCTVSQLNEYLTLKYKDYIMNNLLNGEYILKPIIVDISKKSFVETITAFLIEAK